jgi:hypothetical protein
MLFPGLLRGLSHRLANFMTSSIPGQLLERPGALIDLLFGCLHSVAHRRQRVSFLSTRKLHFLQAKQAQGDILAAIRDIITSSRYF